MWLDAAGALKEVVAELRPDVVLGYQMWDPAATADDMGLRQASLRRNVLR